MNKTILALALALTAAATGCAMAPAHHTSGAKHEGCWSAYSYLKTEGPPLEQDLRSCLHRDFKLDDPICLDSARFAEFTANSAMVETCVDHGWLRPSAQDVRPVRDMLGRIAVLARGVRKKIPYAEL